MTPREPNDGRDPLNGVPRPRRRRAAQAAPPAPVGAESPKSAKKPRRNRSRVRRDESLYRSVERGGPAESERVKAERLAAKVTARLAKCKAFQFPNPRIVMEYEAAARALGLVARELANVPPGWKPPPGTVGQPPIVEGTEVVLRDHVRNQYEGLLDNVRAPLIAKKFKGTRLFVEAVVDGTSVLVPVRISHVQRAVPKEARA